MRISVHTIRLVSLSGCLTLLLSAVVAWSSGAGGATPENTTENTPPPLSRNPFVSGPGGRISAPAGKPGRHNRPGGLDRPAVGGDNIMGMKVTGVLLDNNDAMAILGDRVVKIGDMIDEYIVIGITRTSVTLSNGERILQLFIGN